MSKSPEPTLRLPPIVTLPKRHYNIISNAEYPESQASPSVQRSPIQRWMPAVKEKILPKDDLIKKDVIHDLLPKKFSHGNLTGARNASPVGQSTLLNGSYERYDIISHAVKAGYLEDIKSLLHKTDFHVPRKSPLSKILDEVQVTNPHENQQFRQSMQSNPKLFHRQVVVAVRPYPTIPKSPYPLRPFRL